MNFTEKLDINQCRTCYSATKGLKPLSDLTKCGGGQQISYAELLADVSNINIIEDFYNELPQFICDCCQRKLKAAQAFVQQTHAVNERLLAMLSSRKETNDQMNCLEETPVQVKMEYDATTPEAESNWHVELKEEESEELPQGLVSGMRKSDGNDNIELVTIKGTIDSKPGFYVIKTEDDKIRTNLKQPIDSLKNNANDSTDSDEDYQDNQSNDMDWQKEENNGYIKKYKKTEKIVDNQLEDDDVAVPCKQCDKVFNTSKALTRHLRTTHIPEEQKCTCPICFSKFTRACSMYTHMRTFHGPDSVPFVRKPLTHGRVFQCNKCPKNYTQKKYLDVHIKTKHSKENEEKNKIDDIKNSSDETIVKTSNKPLCSICGSSFPNKTHLMVHMRRHTGERPFKCDLCERAFPRLVELTYHRRIHTGEKPFECKICSKTFRVSSKMTTHMRSHTDIRPYKCKQCERSFKYSKDLNIHFRIHTGERPYSCNVCGSTFSQSNSLKAHRAKLGHLEDVLESTEN